MADISKILTEAWLKVNEGIGSAANSIADATKEKVNEINLNSRRSEVLNQLVPKIVEIYRSGATLPEELTTILKELTDIEDQLAALKPAPAAKAPVMEVPEEKNEEAPAAPQDDMEQADSDEDGATCAAEKLPKAKRHASPRADQPKGDGARENQNERLLKSRLSF